MSQPTRRLHHFTALGHLPSILSDGYLRPVESNVGSGPGFGPPHGEHVAPDVVWVTQLAAPRSDLLGLGAYSGGRKYEVRFTIEVPAEDVHPWEGWAKAHGIDRGWMRSLSKSCDPAFTFCIERPVTASEWVEVAVRTQTAGYVAIDLAQRAAVAAVAPLVTETKYDPKTDTHHRWATSDETRRVYEAVLTALGAEKVTS